MYKWFFRLAIGFLSTVLLIAAFGYGIAVQRYKLPPYGQLAEIQAAIKSVKNAVTGEKEWYYRPATNEEDKIVLDNRPEPREPELNLVTSISAGNQLSIRIIDMSGVAVHEWLIDWFELMPDDSYLPEPERPKGRPGTLIHGAVLMPDGDVVFNFETKALIRLDKDGRVVWRQPHFTHHSLEIDPDGFLWAPLKRRHAKASDPRFPDFKPAYDEAVVARINPDDGRIVEEISLYEILIENNLRSLLYLPRGDPSNRPTGDIVHLNDVEVFYGSDEPGIFQPGDVMVSMRNISTILVFDPVTRIIRHHWIGSGFINQHDPDFIDSNRISIFDNNPIGGYSDTQQSRILIADARGGVPEVWYAGTESGSKPFFTDRMGKHQRLKNGHVLVTDTAGGRGFELDQNGTIIWEYFNQTGNRRLGAIWEIQRLPDQLASTFMQ